ncbi:hypothetical protein [Paenibacillus sp. GCM10027626]|uniref:hypothetical protein n=1 Tax=Paenibacillus sp. GCM10027626 TaxID=3273411 RepID=UPI0036440B56
MPETLRAAFGKVNITPEEYAPLQGYDVTTNIANPTQDILDELYAKIVILDDGAERNVIISVDCCLVNEEPFLPIKPFVEEVAFNYLAATFPEGTKRLWGEAAGVTADKVTTHATHTHTAPAYIGQKYTSRIAAEIKKMTSRLQPATVKVASGECAVSVNRRPNLRHNDDLAIDRSLHVLLFESANGEPLGALVNCAVHPTLLTHTSSRVSAEFVGLAMSGLEKRFGGEFVATFIQGFSGDVGPINQFWAETTDTYPKVVKMGQALCENIIDLLPQAQTVAGAPIRSAQKKVALPTNERYYQPSLEATMHALMIGDILLFATSLETFNGYAGQIRTHSPARFTLAAGVSNGYDGYLPTLEAFGEGLRGYEIETTPYSEEACERFISESAMFIQSLYV